MNDPRPQLRATYAHWLRVRTNVRALAASLVVAEASLRRDLARNEDAERETLLEQLRGEADRIETLGRELDAKIGAVRRACDAIEASYVAALVDDAALTRRPMFDEQRSAV